MLCLRLGESACTITKLILGFKDYKLRNYSFKMSNVSIFDTMNVQVLLSTVLKIALRALVSISFNFKLLICIKQSQLLRF